MKVLESQSALLTNYEVYHHITQIPTGSRRTGKKGPNDWETLRTELLAYFHTTPSPLSQQPSKYTQDCIRELIQRLRPYDLSKGEMIMIFNLRPASVAALNTIIEEMEPRFDEQQQGEIVTIISEVLGEFAAQAVEEDGNGNGEAAAAAAERGGQQNGAS